MSILCRCRFSAAPGPRYRITKINQKAILQFGVRKHKHGRTADTDGICTRTSVFIHIIVLTHTEACTYLFNTFAYFRSSIKVQTGGSGFTFESACGLS